MYETDLLLCISLILLFVYIRDAIRDYLKYSRKFKNIQGPPTLPLTIIAYIFTARSNAGEVSIRNVLSVLIFLDYFFLCFCRSQAC